MTSTLVAPRTSADNHNTRQPFPEVPCSPPGSAAPTTHRPLTTDGPAPVGCLGLNRGGQSRHPLHVPARTPLQVYRRPRHDWTDWQPIHDPGVDEQLHERFCPTCGADEISVDELTGDRP